MDNLFEYGISMPWEKSFNEQSAIEKAMNIFWEEGYEGTSIANLIEGTRVNRGSLYNASLAELENLDNPRQAFKTLFDRLLQQAQDDTQKRLFFSQYIS